MSHMELQHTETVGLLSNNSKQNTGMNISGNQVTSFQLGTTDDGGLFKAAAET